MAHLSLSSPYGMITLFADNESLIALEWGQAEDAPATPLLKEAKRQLDAYFNGQLTQFDLPLLPKGTAFQKRVWKHMGRISYGEVETYGEVADKIGSAPRAVGSACGRNPLPIIIPCHRIIGAGGRLTGYTGGAGIETKRALLRLEGAHLNPLFTKGAIAA